MSLEPTKLSKKQSHRERNNSGELDVFEAARYFSGTAEERTQPGMYTKNMSVPHKPMKEGSYARKSLDLPMEKTPANHRLEKHSKEKKAKNPSSPSSKLASFLNSLFTQTSKKKAKSAPQSTKAEDESPGWRRRRRRSISQTHDISNPNAKSVYSCPSSGFRTPPPYSSTKIFKEITSFGDVKQMGSLPNCNGQARSVNADLVEKRHLGVPWLDQRLGFLEKDGDFRNWVLERDGVMGDGLDKRFGKDQEMDDGMESDSSSDLFELQNYDLGVYSNGLPVYETTHLESIKRGPAIISGSA